MDLEERPGASNPNAPTLPQYPALALQVLPSPLRLARAWLCSRPCSWLC